MAHDDVTIAAVAGGTTVTFLFGDVVGSTRAWADRPEVIAAALRDLTPLVASTVGAHDGELPVEQGEGDGFVAVFTRASDAVSSAIDMQLRLTGSEVAVRMAVHTGEATQHEDGRWIGPTLNRAARLRGLAHGGQILLSGVTAHLVLDHLPAGVHLRDLGRHRLRDLTRPEDVRQVCHPDLPAEFPALASLDYYPHNLPVELTSFIGRQAELATISDLLGTHRLVSLIGAGGVGKTRLAVHAAAQLADRMPGGVWLADLAGTGDPGLVPSVVAAAMSVPEQPLQPVTDTVIAHLADEAALVILDNCEHVLDAAYSFADSLLRGCAGVRVLVTSREPLGITGEQVYRVPSLAGDEAAALFAERARAVRATVALESAAADVVDAICARLDGLPLAIELAAARVRMMSPAELLAALSDHFRILSAGRGVALPRQRTLEASVRWSVDLCSAAEQILLRCLAVFAGGFTLAAVEGVCCGDPLSPGESVDLVATLVDKSLVQVEDDDGTTRYRLLETVRAFAANQLAEAGEVEDSRDRHLDYMVRWTEGLGPELAGEYVGAVRRFARELDNWRAAFDWAVQAGRHDEAWRLVAPVGLILAIRFQDDAALSTMGTLPGGRPSDRVRTLVLASEAAVYRGEFETAHGLLAAAMDSAGSDDHLAAQVHLQLGFTLMFEGRDEAAQHVALASVLEHDTTAWVRVEYLTMSGIYAMFCGDVRLANERLDTALQTATSHGARFYVIYNSAISALAKASAGQYAAAEAGLDRAAFELAETRSPLLEAAEVVRAWCASARGEHEAGLAIVEDGLRLARKFNMPLFFAVSGWGKAWISVRAGLRLDEDLLAEAEAMLDLTGLPFGTAQLRAFRAEDALARGDIDAAADLAVTAEQAADSVLTARWAWPATRLTSARILLARGEHQAAESKAHEALARFAEAGMPWGVAETLETLGRIAAALDSPVEAARLLGAGAKVRQDVGWVAGRFEEQCLRDVEHQLTAAIGPDDFRGAWSEGHGLSTDEAVAYAQRGRGERKRPAFGWAALTPAEVDVVRLVVEGLRNRQIAEKLFVSEATVKTHLNRVFGKLGVDNRGALIAVARDREA